MWIVWHKGGVLLAVLVAVVLMAAAGCGGEEKEGPEAAPVPAPPPASGGSGPEAQSSESEGQQAASSASVPSTDEACDVFASAGGFGGFGGGFGGLANIISGAQGGPTIQAEYSRSPTSDEAAAIANFFEEALNEAFGGGVSAECYWEVSASQGDESSLGLWVSLQLPFEPSPEVIQATQDSLAANGATVGGFFSNPVGGESASMIVVGDLPLGLEGDSGGMLMFMGQFAIIIAGQGTDSGSSQSSQAALPAPAQTSNSGSAAPPPPAPIQQISADTQGIIEWFQRKLEDTLGVSLEVGGSFQSSAGGQSSLLVTFQIPEGSSLPSDVTSQFEEIAESANATIVGTINIGGIVVVNFENLSVEGISATGVIAHDGTQNNITVTLQY